MSKHDLRIQMKARLAKEKDGLPERSLSLSENLKQLISQLNLEVVGKNADAKHRLKLGGVMPMQGEPIWYSSFDQDSEIDFSLVHMGDQLQLSYHDVELASIKNKEHGLKLEEKLLAKTVTPEIILVPGLAFTRNLERLGRGRAYFDTFLKHFTGVSIGVFYSFQEVENVYFEAHDEKCNFIVTDKEIIRGK